MTSDLRKFPAGFGRLWTAQTVSSLGDGVSHAALPLLALTLTREPMALAAVTAAGTLPWLLFGVLGGALVDRWDRRRTMWVMDAARAVLLAIPAAAAVFDVLSIPLLAAVAFLLGLGGLFFDTAATAYLPDLLGRDPALLERANARLRGTHTAASATHIVRRRSQRSTSAPPSTPKSSHGSVPAAVTTASAIGSRVNVSAISGSAACDTPSPSEEAVCAVHSRPNPVGIVRAAEVTWHPLRPAGAAPGGTVRRRVTRPAATDRTAPGTRPPVHAAAPPAPRTARR